MPGAEFLRGIDNVEAQIQQPLDFDFDPDRLPPEILSSIFEYLMKIDPKSMLACRLTCHRFKPLIDNILEKKQLSLWNWENSNGETKPGVNHGFMERFLPMNMAFSTNDELTKFLDDMGDHPNNPFPHRGIYFRRIQVPLPLTHGESSADWTFIEEDYHNRPLWHIQEMRRRRGFRPRGHYQWNDPLKTFNNILDKFCIHFTSIILDFGFDKLNLLLSDLSKILKMTPNLQCLLIKGVNIAVSDSDGDPFKILPIHRNLKSIKIMYSSVTQYILQAYHNQVETLQVINIQQSWYSYFENLQWSNSQAPVFGKLKYLKLGEFTSASEFDNFTRLLWYLPDYWKKLECLSLQYSLYHEFHNPVNKLFQLLKYLPNLKALNVGVCGNTKFDEHMSELESEEFGFENGTNNLVKLSLPAQFIKYPKILKKMFSLFPNLNKVRFLNHDNLLLHDSNKQTSSVADLFERNFVPEQVLGLPVNFGVELVLQGLLTEFKNVKMIKVLSVNGDLEKDIFSVFQ